MCPRKDARKKIKLKSTAKGSTPKQRALNRVRAIESLIGKRILLLRTGLRGSAHTAVQKQKMQEELNSLLKKQNKALTKIKKFSDNF